MEPSDLELVRCAASGDEDSFHALVDRHSGDLFRVALALAHNRDDAEDVLQETFVAAFRGLKGFAGRSSVRTWLIRILTRKAATAWYRSRHVRKTLSLHAPDGQPEREHAAGIAHDDVAGNVQRRMDVMQVLKGMPEAYREVLVLREIRQLSYEEIADALNVPRGTVESRLFRAREDFRRRYTREDR